MNIWLFLLILFGLGVAYIVIEIYRETHSFVVTHYQIESEKLSKDMGEIKIAFLSDFHNQEYGSASCELVNAIALEQPDVILIGGDMLVGKKGHSYANAVNLVEQLPKIAPVYYANGNHEQRMHENAERYGETYNEYKAILEKAGVHFLVNEKTMVEKNGQKIEIAGMELPKGIYVKASHYMLKEEEIEARIGKSGENYTILLAHHPKYAEEYWKWGADLALSGHLHGGVVRLPIIGGVISPQIHLFPYYSGDCYRSKGKTMVVSKGLGTHTLNIRFWNRAELVILTLNGK